MFECKICFEETTSIPQVTFLPCCLQIICLLCIKRRMQELCPFCRKKIFWNERNKYFTYEPEWNLLAFAKKVIGTHQEEIFEELLIHSELDLNMEIDGSNETLVHYVLEHGNVKMVKIMLGNKRDLKWRKGNEGHTPLLKCSYFEDSNHRQMISEVLNSVPPNEDLGLDLVSSSNGYTLPISLVVNNDVNNFKILIKKFKFDPELTNINLRTYSIMHTAVFYGHHRMVKLLLQNFPKISLEGYNHCGYDIFKSALISKNMHTIKLLKEYMDKDILLNLSSPIYNFQYYFDRNILYPNTLLLLERSKEKYKKCSVDEILRFLICELDLEINLDKSLLYQSIIYDAIKEKDAHTVEFLLKEEPKFINVRNHFLQTPLQFAIEHESGIFIMEILWPGSSLRTKDYEGTYLIDSILKNDNEEALKKILHDDFDYIIRSQTIPLVFKTILNKSLKCFGFLTRWLIVSNRIKIKPEEIQIIKQEPERTNRQASREIGRWNRLNRRRMHPWMPTINLSRIDWTNNSFSRNSPFNGFERNLETLVPEEQFLLPDIDFSIGGFGVGGGLDAGLTGNNQNEESTNGNHRERLSQVLNELQRRSNLEEGDLTGGNNLEDGLFNIDLEESSDNSGEDIDYIEVEKEREIGVIHYLTYSKNFEFLNELLKIDPLVINDKDSLGNNALMYAIDRECKDLVNLLISFGCEKEAMNENGIKVSDFAKIKKMKI